MLVALACLAELLHAAGLHTARHARALAAGGDLPAALQAATSSRRMAPYHPHALYTQISVLKRMARWQELVGIATPALAWTPEAVNAQWLLGEAHWRRNEYAAASEHLWGAFWLDPLPSPRPLAIWRMALHAATQPGAIDPAHRPPLVRAAAAGVLMLLDDDATLTPDERAAALAETLRARDQSDVTTHP